MALAPAEQKEAGQWQLNWPSFFIELSLKGDQAIQAGLNQLRTKVGDAESSAGRARGTFMELVGLTRRMAVEEKGRLDQTAKLYDTGPYKRFAAAQMDLDAAEKKNQVAKLDVQAKLYDTAPYRGMMLAQANLDRATAVGERARLEAKSKIYSTEPYKALVAAEADLGRASRKDQQLRDWARLTEESGKFGGGLRKLGGQLQEIGRSTGGLGFGSLMMGGAIGVMSHAAGGGVFDTFTASFEYLFGVIGSTFTPALLSLAKTVQDVADWIDQLNPVIKSLAGSIIIWGAAIFGVVKLLGGFIYVVGTVASGLGTVVGWLRRLASASAASAFVSGSGIGPGMSSAGGGMGAMGWIGVAVAGVGLLVGGLSALANAAVAAHQRIEALAIRLEEGGSMTPREAAAAMGDMRVRGGTGGTLSDAMRGRTPAEREAILRAEVTSGNAEIAAHSGRAGTAGVAIGMRHRVEVLEGLLANPALIDQGLAVAAGGRGRPLATNYRFQSEFQSVEERWRSLMRIGGGLTPAQAQQLDLSRKSLEALLSIKDSSATMAGELPGMRPGMATGP